MSPILIPVAQVLSQVVSISPAPSSWAAAEVGYEWLGLTPPLATPSAGVTTGFGISIFQSGQITYLVCPTPWVPTSLQFGFVPSTSPSSTTPSTWYPGQIAVVNTESVASLQVGGSGLFQPAVGTTWWAWLWINGLSPIQTGQLLSVT